MPVPCAFIHHDKLPRVQRQPVRSPVFLVALLVGLLIRLAALQLPITPGIAIRTSPHYIDHYVDSGGLPGGWHWNALIKLPGLMCAAALTVLLYRVTASRTGSVNHARWAALAIWVNPALILNGEASGSGAPLVMLPAVTALLVAHRGAPLAAGIFGGIAAGLSPDGALVLPAVAVAVHSLGPRLGLTRAAAGAVLGAGVALSPLALGGRLDHAATAMREFYLRGDLLSAYAANLWWILSWAHGVRHLVPHAKPLVALRVMTEPVAVPKSLTIAGRKIPLLHPPLVAAAAAVIWCIRACWNTLGSIRLSLHAALAALTVHIAYVVLMGMKPSQVLEVPLLALAGALEPALRPLFYIVTVIVALNMNLFDGVGAGMRWAIPRGITFIDASVIVAAVNLMALFWLSGLLRDLAAESRGAYGPTA
jgi:hypothetical protein